jgi:hypothetical protein
MVFRFVKGKQTEGLCLEGMAGQFVAKTIAGFLRFEKNLRLIFGRIQSQIDQCLHKVFFYSRTEFLSTL